MKYDCIMAYYQSLPEALVIFWCPACARDDYTYDQAFKRADVTPLIVRTLGFSHTPLPWAILLVTAKPMLSLLDESCMIQWSAGADGKSSRSYRRTIMVA